MISIIPDKYKIPDNYRRKVLSGYYSIILIFLGTNLVTVFYGYLNINLQIILAIVTLIPGFILWVYFFIGFTRIMVDLIKNNDLKNNDLIKNKSKLRTHYLLIWGLYIIWIVLNHFIYNLNLSSIFIPIICILLIIKFMR